jgi:hypothetical protein
LFRWLQGKNFSTTSAIQREPQQLKRKLPHNSSKLARDVIAQLCVVILLALANSITTHNCSASSLEDFFEQASNAQAKFQPQLTGVTLSAQNSPSERRFGSSGFNLTFEGLLLAVSLQHRTKGTNNVTRKLSPKHAEGVQDAFAHSEGTILHVSRKVEKPEVPEQSSCTEAIGGLKPEAACRWLGGGSEGRSRRPCHRKDEDRRMGIHTWRHLIIASKSTFMM